MPPRIIPRFCACHFLYVMLFGGLCDASADKKAPTRDPSLRLAIVGAGVAGSFAAFHLYELSHSAPISITIYESEPVVGGRVVSVPIPDALGDRVEAGAPDLFPDDDCLIGGMESTGLEFPYADFLRLPKRVGLWDRQGIIAGLSCNMESPSWQYLARLTARYGISAWRFHRTMVSVSKRWKRLNRMPPFDNISYALREVGLDEGLAFDSAETYLRKLGIAPKFLNEIVEPCTRARFSQNLANASVLSALMAARKEKDSILGGNTRLIERIINLSGADLRLNTTVIGIRDGDTRRYRLSAVSTTLTNPSNMMHSEYDIVILAFPLQEGGINLTVPQLRGRLAGDSLESRAYGESHVTHFSTSTTISPSFFSLPLNASIPDILLTSAQSSNILSTDRSDICFNRYCDPGPELDECDECDDDTNMYRVVSRRPLSDIDLARLVGKQWREGQDLADIDITWVHRQAWSQTLPGGNRNSSDMGNIEIAPNIFYLGGMERVLNTMEMSRRIGRNVARLLTKPGVDEMGKSHVEL